MVARRVAPFLSEANAIDCPNQDESTIENKAENRGLSKGKSTLSAAVSDPHKRASRILGLALTLDTQSGWNGAAAVWGVRLSDNERANIAHAALQTLDLETAQTVVEYAFGGAGVPTPPFLDPLYDAQGWADFANASELRAYCLAAFVAMKPKDKRDFLTFAQGVCA